MKTLYKIAGSIGICATMAVIGMPVLADTAPASPEFGSVTVVYDDLNLSNQAGIQTLYERLRRAAIKACAPRPDLHNSEWVRNWRTCVDQALDNAVQRTNMSSLARVHFDATGHSVDPRLVGK